MSRDRRSRGQIARGAPAAALSLLVMLGGCSPTDGGGKPSVVASVYPLSFIAEEIAGDEVEVTALSPGGGEPHDLELTPSQARSIAEAAFVLYVGAGFQPAVEDALEQTENGLDVLGLVKTIDAGEHAEEEGEDDHADDHGGADPHAWLDPTQAALIADSVFDRLVELAPEHEEEFRQRHAELRASFEEIDSEFTSGLEDCEERTIVVSHEAFGYLTERYGLEQMGISGIDPEQEPSPQRLAEVARFVADRDIGTIFLEKAVSPDVGETLAEETGASVDYLDPLEVGPPEGDLFTVMRDNLEALQRGLGCGGAV